MDLNLQLDANVVIGHFERELAAKNRQIAELLGWQQAAVNFINQLISGGTVTTEPSSNGQNATPVPAPAMVSGPSEEIHQHEEEHEHG